MYFLRLIMSKSKHIRNMKNEIVKELHDISPFMSDLRGKLTVSNSIIPEDYFEQLADNIIGKAKENPSFNDITLTDKLLEAKKVKIKSSTFKTIIRPLRAVAATFLFITCSWWAFNKFSTKTIRTDSTGITQVRRDVLKSFISDNIEDYDENVLVEKGILTDEDLNMPSINLKELNTNPELKKYLQENLNTPEDGDL